jgi:uncharacterized protein YciI
MRQQDGWDEHAAFIDALAGAGFVVMAGPLRNLTKPHRSLLVVEAESEEAVHARLAEDPWTPTGMLVTTAIERWEILIGDPASAHE